MKKIAKDKVMQEGLPFKPLTKEELLKLQKEEWLKQKKQDWQRSLRERHTNALGRVSIDDGYIKAARYASQQYNYLPVFRPKTDTLYTSHTPPKSIPSTHGATDDGYSKSAIYPSQEKPKNNKPDRSNSLETIELNSPPKPVWYQLVNC
jgi:hypothetical protein